jgi:acetoin utilization protein AcuB
MKLRDVMRPGTFTISETDGLGAAYAAMTRSHIRHLPVMRGSQLVGTLSERDVLAARAHAKGGWATIPVSEAMHSPAQTAGPDDSLTEVAGRMALAKIGALPVVSHGRLLGMATVADVLQGEVRDAMTPAPRTTLTAADAMTPYPFAVQPRMLLVEAVAIMVDHHVRHLPVVDEHSTLVGMLSDRDVRSAVGDPAKYAEDRSASPVQIRVVDVMTDSAAHVPYDAPITEIAKRFADEKIGAMPVTDRFGALLGIISYVDVLRALVPTA